MTCRACIGKHRGGIVRERLVVAQIQCPPACLNAAQDLLEADPCFARPRAAHNKGAGIMRQEVDHRVLYDIDAVQLTRFVREQRPRGDGESHALIDKAEKQIPCMPREECRSDLPSCLKVLKDLCDAFGQVVHVRVIDGHFLGSTYVQRGGHVVVGKGGCTTICSRKLFFDLIFIILLKKRILASACA